MNHPIQRGAGTALQSNSADGAMLSPTASAIEVLSGLHVDLLDPQPEQITLLDICHALARLCRYSGHVMAPGYSVAEHSNLVHDLLVWQGYEPPLTIAGLLHDAAEAYLQDVVAPAKFALRIIEHGRADLGAYDELTERMEAAIAARFALDPALLNSDEVRLTDMWALRIEARVLTRSKGETWRYPDALPNGGLLPREVDWTSGLASPGHAFAGMVKRAHAHVPAEAIGPREMLTFPEFMDVA